MISIRIHRFDTVSSTNDVALQMARAGEPEGTVVLARSQSAGRGRRGRTWLDEPGTCVLMSAMLRPDLPPDRFPELSFVASLSVAEYLRRAFAFEPALKWPNDVLIRERKAAGVLVETTGGFGAKSLPKHSCGAVVVGIGLNVNQTRFPPEIADSATSVAIETGSPQDVDAAALSLAEALFANYEAYLARGFEEILSRWRKYMWGAGRQASVETEGRVLQGIILGVDCSGALLLHESSGEVHVIRAADSLTIRLSTLDF
jgi:BirA family biotin operon repressor/biotin-[acetyl-CoA-carboxylase] ligase